MYKKQYMQKKEKELAAWVFADKLLTRAGATKVKYLGLLNAQNTEKLGEGSQLLKAIPKLKESGQNDFNEAMRIVGTLSPEDVQLFWKAQERNKDAKCFDDLVREESIVVTRFFRSRRACINVAACGLTFSCR